MRRVLGLAFVCLLATAGSLSAGGQADVRAEMQTLIGKAIEATGGEAKLARLQTATWKGEATLTVGGQQLTLKHEGTARGWDQYHLNLDVQVNGRTQNLVVGINKDKAWARAGGNQANDIPAKDFTPAKHFLYALRVVHLLPTLKDKAYDLSPLGEIKIGDRAAVGVTIAHKQRPDIRLFFDKENGLPVKTEIRLTDPQGQEINLECLFSDYKDFDGLKHFTRIAFKLDNREASTEISDIRPQEQVDASLFAKP